MKKSLRRFWEFRIIKPYKIIILIGALVFGRVEDVKGQTSPWVVTDGPWWTVGNRERITFEQSTADRMANIAAYAKMSVSEVARITPWVKMGVNFRNDQNTISLVYEHQRNIYPHNANGQRDPNAWQEFHMAEIDFYSSRAGSSFLITAGADFRITNNNLIRVSAGTQGLYAGLVRRQPITQRISLELGAGVSREVHTQNTTVTRTGRSGWSDVGVPGTSSTVQSVSGGIRFRKEMGRNVKLQAGVSFARAIGHNSDAASLGEMINDARRIDRDWPTILPIPTPARTTPLNSLNFSIGIHKNLRVGNVPQVTLERRQRQARPRRQQLAPCPHMQPRPWETVHPFNHPSQPGRNR